jgi:hypothetical protein
MKLKYFFLPKTRIIIIYLHCLDTDPRQQIKFQNLTPGGDICGNVKHCFAFWAIHCQSFSPFWDLQG